MISDQLQIWADQWRANRGEHYARGAARRLDLRDAYRRAIGAPWSDLVKDAMARCGVPVAFWGAVALLIWWAW